MSQELDPTEIDSLTARLKGFVVAAFSDTVARECTAARAAEADNLRQAANALLKESPYNDPALGGMVARAFDEVFKRTADPLNRPAGALGFPQPDGRLGGFGGGAAELRQARGEGGIYPNLPASNPLPTAAHSRTALDKVSRGTPVFGSGPAKPEVSYDAILAGARYDDMSPEAVAERARLVEKRAKSEARLRAEREQAENERLASLHVEQQREAASEAEKAAERVAKVQTDVNASLSPDTTNPAEALDSATNETDETTIYPDPDRSNP